MAQAGMAFSRKIIAGSFPWKTYMEILKDDLFRMENACNQLEVNYNQCSLYLVSIYL